MEKFMSMFIYRVILGAAVILTLTGIAQADYLKCSKQAINPYKGKMMSAGAGTVWIKKTGTGYTESSEFEAMKEAYATLQDLKK
jgi:hypothetical protein